MAKKRNEGKEFEADFKRSVPIEAWVYRFKDGSASWGTETELNINNLNVCLSQMLSKSNSNIDIEDIPEFTNELISIYKVVKPPKTRFQASNICDFEIFKSPYLYLLELKSTKGKSLSFSSVRDNQVKELTEASTKKDIVSGFVVNFRDVNETYFMSIDLYNQCVKTLDSKSIPIKIFRDHSYLIGQHKKQVRFSYDIATFLKSVKPKEKELF